MFDLTERALARGHKILIRLRDEGDANRLNDFLWTNKADSFLPHGMASDDNTGLQPVCLTAASGNPNQADALFIMPGAESAAIEDFKLVCDILDGRDEDQITLARSRYRDWKNQGHTISYWQQSDAGKWEQK